MSDNTTFTNLGAQRFFNRYPVCDISMLVETVPIQYDKITRFKLEAQRRVFNTPYQATQRVDRFVGGYKPVTGRPARADELQVVDKTHRVHFFDITGPGDRGRLSTVTATKSLTPVTFTLRSDPQPGWLPLFYLPYDLNRFRRITLRDKQGVGNVNFFLTDIVDGCSVYIEGTPQNPSVSHINANSVLPTGHAELPSRAQPAERKAAWTTKADHMQQRFDNAAKPTRVVANDPSLSPARKVDYKHYGFRVKQDEDNFEAMLATLQHKSRVPLQGKRIKIHKPLKGMEKRQAVSIGYL
jgi:hypothetical protein